MKMSITGGAGFLGYHICNQLSNEFDEIQVIDTAPIDTGEYPPHTEYAQIDVRDKERLKGALRGTDVIIHAAAALPLWKKKDIFDINIAGTRNVLDVALHYAIERVVVVSSTAVYGVPKKHPIYENDKLIGVGAYGESKIIAEFVCDEYRKKGLCIPVIRPKTFIGTGRLGVFQILYDWVESGKKIPVIGRGINRYQLLDVEDLVSAIDMLIKASHKHANDTFNVGAEEFHSVLDDVGALCSYAKSGARVMPTPAPVVIPLLMLFESLGLSPLYKWVYGTAGRDSFVSVDKIKDRFGWSARYSNADTLIRAYQWYLDNKNKVSDVGITHRVAWKQGILGFIKKFM